MFDPGTQSPTFLLCMGLNLEKPVGPPLTQQSARDLVLTMNTSS
jgi:hypothetical protein